MNSRDFTRTFTSGSFVGYFATLVALGVVFGVILGLVVNHFGSATSASGTSIAQLISTDGGYVVIFFVFLSNFFILLLARGATVGAITDDRFAGLLEAPLSRSVSRSGLVFARFAGVATAVVLTAVAGPVALIVTFYFLTHLTLPYGAAELLVAGVVLSGLVMTALAFLYSYVAGTASRARGMMSATVWLLYVLYFIVFFILSGVAFRQVGSTFSVLPFLEPYGRALLEANPLLLVDTLYYGWIPSWQQLAIGVAWLAVVGGGLGARVALRD